MAVDSSSRSSLTARDLELEREINIYIPDAASSLGFNLKTEQDESALFPFPLVWQISMLHLLPKVTFFTELTTNNGRSTQTNLHFSKASLSLEFYTRNVILPTSSFKQKSHTLIRAFQEHQKCVHE